MRIPHISLRRMRRPIFVCCFMLMTVALAQSQATAPKKLVLAPSKGPAGTTVKFTGPPFGASGTVVFGALTGTPVSWADTEVDETVPDAGSTKNVKWKVTVKDSSGNTIGVGEFTETPGKNIAGNAAAKAASDPAKVWGDDDEHHPIGYTMVGGLEQGYQSAKDSNGYGFVYVGVRTLFLGNKIGPFAAIRLQTAPQASDSNGLVSVFTDPAGAITTQSLQGVGTAVDLNLGVDFKKFDLPINDGQTSIDFIAGGGFVTPVLGDKISATFATPGLGTVECNELQDRLTDVLKQPQYVNIHANSASSGASGCYTNDSGTAPVAISKLIYATPDRNSFYGKSFVGLRIVNRYKLEGNDDKPCKKDSPCMRGFVDFTIGQNASITGGKMRHFVFTADAIHPLPGDKVDYIYLFGSISKRIFDGTKTLPPLILNPGPALTGAPSVEDLVLPLNQPNRDFYRIGVGISLDKLIKKAQK